MSVVYDEEDNIRIVCICGSMRTPTATPIHTRLQNLAERRKYPVLIHPSFSCHILGVPRAQALWGGCILPHLHMYHHLQQIANAQCMSSSRARTHVVKSGERERVKLLLGRDSFSAELIGMEQWEIKCFRQKHNTFYG